MSRPRCTTTGSQRVKTGCAHTPKENKDRGAALSTMRDMEPDVVQRYRSFLAGSTLADDSGFPRASKAYDPVNQEPSAQVCCAVPNPLGIGGGALIDAAASRNSRCRAIKRRSKCLVHQGGMGHRPVFAASISRPSARLPPVRGLMGSRWVSCSHPAKLRCPDCRRQYQGGFDIKMTLPRDCFSNRCSKRAGNRHRDSLRRRGCLSIGR
jgi:hypothetical protein